MDIYFIRHTSVAVPPGTCYGLTDVALSDTFEQEAEATRMQIAGIRFDAVYTSPLTRARRLARYCGYPDARVDARVREFNFGEWEMKSYGDLYASDPRFARWCGDFHTRRAPGGDSLADQRARVDSFIDDVRRAPHERVAVFAHGGVLALAQVYAGTCRFADALAHVPPYGSVVRVSLPRLAAEPAALSSR